MSEYPPYRDQASIAAKLETAFDTYGDSLGNLMEGYHLDSIGLPGCKIVNVAGGSFTRKDGTPYPKAITIMDSEGNLYVHFRGTGNGNWGYNPVAYGDLLDDKHYGNIADKSTSDIQDWALDYFDRMVAEHYDSEGKLYVTGHSQGGNNAQFVTIRSQYGDYIDACVELDGQGFSNKFVEDSKNMYGEAYYNQQRDKIYAYNGGYDYVSCLGQETIVLKDHTFFVETDKNTSDISEMIKKFHDVTGFHFDENGQVVLYGGDGLDCSDFRKFIISLNKIVITLDPADQERAGQLVMKLCELYLAQDAEFINATELKFTGTDLEDFKALLVPIIVEVLQNHPDALASILTDFGVDAAYVDLFISVVSEYNELSPELREEAWTALSKLIVIKENGEFGISFDTVEMADFLAVVKVVGPTIWETLLHHPADLVNVLYELEIDKKIATFIADHPAAAIALALLSPVLVKIVGDFAAAAMLIDAIVHIIEGIKNIANQVKQFIVNTLNAVKEMIKKIQEWFFKHSSGYQYAQANPYFRVDTDSLRSYASRLQTLNNRLVKLDIDMNHLYPQVRPQDLLKALYVDWETGWSLTLNWVADDLYKVANILDEAENKACGYLGG